MSTPELPPLKLPALPSLPSRSLADHERYIIELREVMKCRERLLEARERILLARIAELEADAFGARRALWVVLRSTSRGMWYTPSLSAFMEHGEGAEIQTRHEPRGDISYFAAIDAARKA